MGTAQVSSLLSIRGAFCTQGAPTCGTTHSFPQPIRAGFFDMIIHILFPDSGVVSQLNAKGCLSFHGASKHRMA